MELQKAVALRISQLLIKNKLTRYALCKKICIPEQTLKHIIDERNQNVLLRTITAVAHGFDMSLSEFFDDSLFDKNKLEF